MDEKLNGPRVEVTPKQQDQLDFAKSKLSKWASRLFDPNRLRGLVEAPKVIPLSDEFLTAFGKRGKEHDNLSGRVIDIDQTSLDVIDVSEDEDEGIKKFESKKVNFSEMTKCKMKLSNLSYGTTTATIARTCGAIGPVVDVNLILDDTGRSSGRAYAVFEDLDAALMCVKEMNEKPLEGRTIRVALASASSGKKTSGGPRKQESRYWERDISTKCVNCEEVGHDAKNCPKGETLKPCGLCAEVGHDMWSCPQWSVCFNCGVPEHMSRDCTQRRGLPERQICTICYQSGHHRFECRQGPWNAPSHDAVCIQCGQRGLLMCMEFRWFFGLKGVTCFNCGGKDHAGVNCRNPDVDQCAKNPEVALNQINMAGVMDLSDQLSSQRLNRELHDRQIRQNSSSDGRARSMPPSHGRGSNDPPRQRSNVPRDLRWQNPPSQVKMARRSL